MNTIRGTVELARPLSVSGRVVVAGQIVVGGSVLTLATYLRLVQETGQDMYAVMSQKAVTDALAGKQDALVSGQNIKTINGESVLGSGNIEVGGGSGTSDYEELTHKPQINGVTLSGNKTSSDLGVAAATHTHTASQITDFPTIPDELADLADDSTHRLVTDAEKSAWDGKYDKPAGGIPKTDLDSSVQTSLGKADTALQTETDPTVPAWAKEANKPTYDYSEITNTPTIPTVNDATLKIQRNGTDLDTFTANASQNKTINIVVPTSASDVSALPDSTKYGASLSLSINSSTYVITAQLKDQDNNNLGTAQTIDLPLESVVVNGSYDDATKKIILTLQNGNTIEFSVADLVNGLQTEITANNPLSADLIADGTTNKVYTATEQSKLSGIEAGAEVNVQSDWNQSDNTADDYIKNKPTIPSAQIQSDWNQSDNTALDYIKNKPAVHSIPAGGNAGQVLKKTSATDYDVNWANQSETLPSAYCTTSGGTAAKKANCSLYALQNNQYLQVLIGSANTYQGALTLDINSRGAKPIYINGTASSSSNYTLPNGTYFVFYDGTNYYFRTDGKLPMRDADFGGSYNDLADKPTIPAAQVNADWTANSGVAEILNKPTLGTAAALDVPSSGDAATTEVVKGDDSRLTDARTPTSHTHTTSEITDFPSLATVATSGSYNDLTDTPTIPSAPGTLDTTQTTAQSTNASEALSGNVKLHKIAKTGTYSDLIGTPSLASVATSGSYNDLSNKPTIPDVSTKYDTGDTAETTLDDADYVPFYDTSASGRRKSLWSNIKAKLKTYFDNYYLTSHQDISGKADKVSGATNGNIAGLDSNGNPTDSGIAGTDVSTAITNSHSHSNKSLLDTYTQTEANLADAVSKKHSHSNKTVLDYIPSSLGTAGQALCVNSGASGLEFKTVSGGGGLSNYDFTELSAPTISGGACTITFSADQRNAVEFSTNADLAIALVSNNKADNYMWITNSHATTAIDITFSSILFGSTSINDIKGTASIPSIEAGETLEIGIYVTGTKARITSRIL